MHGKEEIRARLHKGSHPKSHSAPQRTEGIVPISCRKLPAGDAVSLSYFNDVLRKSIKINMKNSSDMSFGHSKIFNVEIFLDLSFQRPPNVETII